MQERERKRQWWLRLPLLVLCSFPMLGWCEEWKPNEQLLQNTWKEMLKITELNPDTPMPQIVFLKSSPPGVQGRCYFQDKKIEIYLGSIRNSIWAQRNAYKKIVVHEMLHYALYLKGVPTRHQHREMKEKGYLLPVIGYINDCFKINANFKAHREGYQEDLSMRSLELGIEKDTEAVAKLAKR